MGQLAEQSLPTPYSTQVRIPSSATFEEEHFVYCWNDENKENETSGWYYKASTIVIYDSAVVLTWKLLILRL